VLPLSFFPHRADRPDRDRLRAVDSTRLHAVRADGATMTCPAPIGTVPKEDCADIADDFGSFTVQGALSLATAGKESQPRLEAIRATAALAQSIKEQRVKLCEAYVRCKVPVADRDAQDQLLAGRCDRSSTPGTSGASRGSTR